jgi:hypothetical protein
MFHVIMLSVESSHALISNLASFGILPVFQQLGTGTDNGRRAHVSLHGK